MTTIIENKPVPRNFWPQKVKSHNYIMGFSPLPQKVLMPTGHGWKDYRPIGETQQKNWFDPQSCPAGGTENCVEGLGLLQYKNLGFQSDLSDRYLSIMMGMNGNGGWPWRAAEVWRQYAGAIPEVFLPFDDKIDTVQKYFSPRPMSYALFKIGIHWNKIYDFGHEWVFHAEQNLSLEQKQGLMKEALKYSPLGVAGYAWSKHEDGKYYSDGPAIHWFRVDDWSQDNSWNAFDSYPPYDKELDYNYNFEYCIRYHLGRRPGAENTVFNPENAEECKFDYALYLIRWFISNFTKQ